MLEQGNNEINPGARQFFPFEAEGVPSSLSVLLGICILLLGLRRIAHADALDALEIYARSEHVPLASPHPVVPQRRVSRGRRSDAMLLYPIPAGGRLTSPFGYRIDPIDGRWSFHGGVDLASPRGTPVIATHSGWISSRYTRNSGWVVRIVSKSYVTSYHHLDSVLFRTGYIRAGVVLGTVGRTGRHANGNHLHYSVAVASGRLINPVSTFP